MKQSIHESFANDEPVVPGSDRSFGIVMAAALALLTAVSIWRQGGLWPWTGGTALLFLAAALGRPILLAPLNRAWHRLGLLLHAVVNPVVMAFMFYLGVVPTGLILRLTGKDPLRLKWSKDAESYWIPREPPGPAPASMKDQF